jgi:hypothetical protein
MNRRIFHKNDYVVVYEGNGYSHDSYCIFNNAIYSEIPSSWRNSFCGDTKFPEIHTINKNLYKLYTHFCNSDFTINFIWGNRVLFTISKEDYDKYPFYDFGALIGENKTEKLYNDYQISINEDKIRILCNNGNHKIFVIQESFNEWFAKNKMVITKTEIIHYNITENFKIEMYEKINSNLIKECDFIFSVTDDRVSI